MFAYDIVVIVSVLEYFFIVVDLNDITAVLFLLQEISWGFNKKQFWENMLAVSW